MRSHDVTVVGIGMREDVLDEIIAILITRD